MIVVDSTVWAGWFNGLETPGRTARTCARSGRRWRHSPDPDRGAPGIPKRLFRLLRRRGVTIRGTIECVIAQSCIVAGVELLSIDQDFVAIARHTPLRLCRP